MMAAAMLKLLAKKGFNVKEYRKSEDGKWFSEKCKNDFYRPVGNPDTNEYWLQHGLEVQTFGTNKDWLTFWAAYLPAGYDKQKDRTYPLVFFNHGKDNPISTVQSFDILDLAAKEQFIVITCANLTEHFLMQVYDYVCKNYPVDISRVYHMGFSMGGHVSAQMGLLHPELFAGIGVASMMTIGEKAEGEINGINYPEVVMTEDIIAHAAELKLPCCIVNGDSEMIRYFPLYDSDLSFVSGDNMRFTINKDHEYRVFNTMRRLAGCSTITPEENKIKSMKSSDEVEQKIGACFEKTEISMEHGRNYYTGYSINSKGQCLFTLTAVEGLPHVPSIDLGKRMWNYLKKFSRDTETGVLLINGHED